MATSKINLVYLLKKVTAYDSSEVDILSLFLFQFVSGSFAFKVLQLEVVRAGVMFKIFICLLFIYLALTDFSCSIWDIVPLPGIEPRSPPLGVHTLSHWPTKEVLEQVCYYSFPFPSIHASMSPDVAPIMTPVAATSCFSIDFHCHCMWSCTF